MAIDTKRRLTRVFVFRRAVRAVNRDECEMKEIIVASLVVHIYARRELRRFDKRTAVRRIGQSIDTQRC